MKVVLKPANPAAQFTRVSSCTSVLEIIIATLSMRRVLRQPKLAGQSLLFRLTRPEKSRTSGWFL